MQTILNKLTVTLLFVGLALSPGSAWADPGESTVKRTRTVSTAVDLTDEELEEVRALEAASPLPFTVSGTVSGGANLGSLYLPNFQTIDSVQLRFVLGLYYRIWQDWTASVIFGASQFVTPHGVTRQYEGRFGDISLAISDPVLYTVPVARIRMTAGLSATVPTSDFSQFQGLRTSIGANLGLSRGVGPVTLSYGLRASKNFHRFTTIVFNSERFAAEALVRANSPEAVTETRIAIMSGILPEWTVTHSLQALFRLPANFGATVGFSLTDSWTYADATIMEDDAFTNQNAVAGRGRNQIMVGSLGVNYAFLNRYSVSASVATGQPPKTFDNQRFRFPFWDTQSGNLSYTTVGLSLSANY
jgi:hypothetical protein